MSRSYCCYLAWACLLPALASAQTDQIAGQISSDRLTPLSGNVNPLAQPKFDQGPVESSMLLPYVTLMLRKTPAQQQDLEQLLRDQQDRSSPLYHQWLTPEQYAGRFGASQADLAKISAWLQSEGFSIQYTARSRNWIAFSGTAQQIQATFHTEIHRYKVDGETHYANATEPSVPAAFAPMLLGLLGLDDFRPKPAQSYTGYHLWPTDLATIYDLNPLYKAGIDGSGQRVVVVGASDFLLSDIQAFRAKFGLPQNTPQQMLFGPDPGFVSGAEGEADLDLEWLGAVARNAAIIYVYSQSVWTALEYAIEQNLAPVISVSFGQCEYGVSPSQVNALEAAAQQANSQGITLLAASGDAGAAGCDPHGPSSGPAKGGEHVSIPASIPEVTAVGGTEFNEGSGDYWSFLTDSALSYIPEIAWNDSFTLNYLAASGGGYSTLFARPSWQLGTGMPGSTRAVPDVSMTASWYHDPYALYTNGQLWAYANPDGEGGTSASTPVFAGIITLLNQYQGPNSQGVYGQGNINPTLYQLAQTVPGIFHDITSGNNIVPCQIGTPDCTTGSFGYYAGPGYDPVTGLGSVDAYEFVTQWNAGVAPSGPSNVVPSCNPDPVYESEPNAQGYSWFATITLQETAGVATTLTGFTIGGTDYSSQLSNWFATTAIPANGSISTNIEWENLAVPTTITFTFAGVDASGQQWSRQLSVPFYGYANANTPTISSVVNAASYQRGIAPGALATIFGSHLSGVSGVMLPGGATTFQGVSVTVAGVQAPLFAIANVNGQEQINFQVPAGLASPGTVQVEVNNNSATGSISGVPINPVQPGIFEYTPAGSSSLYAAVLKPDGSVAGPSNPASRGTTVSLFMTGLGPTNPPLSTGQPGPVPPATTGIPIVALNNNGVPVVFSGAAPGFIGLDQVNFQIPAGAPTGPSIKLSVGAYDANGTEYYSQDSRIAIQ